MTVAWNVISCHLKMEAANCSKILVHIYQTLLCHIQEDSSLNVYWHQIVRPQDKLDSNCTLPSLQVYAYSSLQ